MARCVLIKILECNKYGSPHNFQRLYPVGDEKNEITLSSL